MPKQIEIEKAHAFLVDAIKGRRDVLEGRNDVDTVEHLDSVIGYNIFLMQRLMGLQKRTYLTSAENWDKYVDTGDSVHLGDIKDGTDLWVGRNIVVSGIGWEKSLMVKA